MLKRRTIGISFACLVISTGAMAKPHPGQSHGAKPQHAEQRSGKLHTVAGKTAFYRSAERHASHHAALPRHRHLAAHAIAAEGGGPPDSYLGATAVPGREIGKAAWYNRVGAYTANGERL